MVMIALKEVLNAVRFGQKFAVVKHVDVELGLAALIPANEMPRQTDPRDGQPQAVRQQDVNQAQVDRIGLPAVNDPVEVAVFRVVIVFLIAREAKVTEKALIERDQQLFGPLAGIDFLGHGHGELVQQGAVSLYVNGRVAGLSKEPRALLKIEILAGVQAEPEEPVVVFLAFEDPDDGLRATAKERVVAETMGAEPVRGLRTVRENGSSDLCNNGRIFVRQELQ